VGSEKERVLVPGAGHGHVHSLFPTNNNFIFKSSLQAHTKSVGRHIGLFWVSFTFSSLKTAHHDHISTPSLTCPYTSTTLQTKSTRRRPWRNRLQYENYPEMNINWKLILTLPLHAVRQLELVDLLLSLHRFCLGKGCWLSWAPRRRSAWLAGELGREVETSAELLGYSSSSCCDLYTPCVAADDDDDDADDEFSRRCADCTADPPIPFMDLDPRWTVKCQRGLDHNASGVCHQMAGPKNHDHSSILGLISPTAEK